MERSCGLRLSLLSPGEEQREAPATPAHSLVLMLEVGPTVLDGRRLTFHGVPFTPYDVGAVSVFYIKWLTNQIKKYRPKASQQHLWMVSL